MKIFPNKPSVRQKNFVNTLIKSFLQTLYKTGQCPHFHYFHTAMSAMNGPLLLKKLIMTYEDLLTDKT